MTPERLQRWSRAKRVLAVRLDAMGDVLMTEPALRALAAGGPGREVTLLTSPAGAAAARLLAGVARTIEFEAPWVRAQPERLDGEAERELVERLRGEDFDAAVIFTVYSQNPLPAATLLHLAGIPLRLAYCREKPYYLLSDWQPEREPEEIQRHEVRRHLDLVGAAGMTVADERMRADPGDEARRRVAGLVENLGLGGDRRWLVVHPGASAPSRRYPPEYYGQVAWELWHEHGLVPLFTGSEGERELVAGIRSGAGGVGFDLSGELSLAELCALLEAAPLLLSNNTGPAHLAAAVGTPVVDLYALTNLQHTPWQVPSRVLSFDVPCAPCYSSVCQMGHHLCLRGVHPDRVVEAVLELLSQSRPAGDTKVEHAATS